MGLIGRIILNKAIPATWSARGFKLALTVTVLTGLRVTGLTLNAVLIAIVTLLKTVHEPVSNFFNGVAGRVRRPTTRVPADARTLRPISVDILTDFRLLIAVTILNNALIIRCLNHVVAAKTQLGNGLAISGALLKSSNAGLPVAGFRPFGEVIPAGLKIAFITNAIIFNVNLVGIGDSRTIIQITADAVIILIIGSIIGTGVAKVAKTVAVIIGLVGIGMIWTVILRNGNAIRVRVSRV